MLDQLRAKALTLIAFTPECTLSTSGPAGVQASLVTCLVRDNCVYVLVPSTADHRFNLESEAEVMLTSALWQLRGAALVLGSGGRQAARFREIMARPFARGHSIVEIFPIRMNIEAIGSHRYRTTIDFDPRPGGAPALSLTRSGALTR